MRKIHKKNLTSAVFFLIGIFLLIVGSFSASTLRLLATVIIDSQPPAIYSVYVGANNEGKVQITSTDIYNPTPIKVKALPGIMPLYFEADIRDSGSGVASVTAYYALTYPQPPPVAFGQYTSTMSYNATSNTWQASVNYGGVQDGYIGYVQFVASDYAGNSLTTVNYYYKIVQADIYPPTITNVMTVNANDASQSALLTEGATVNVGWETSVVKATVSDPSGLGGPPKLDGVNMISPDGTPTTPWTGQITVTAGQTKTFTIAASDVYGNTASKSYSIKNIQGPTGEFWISGQKASATSIFYVQNPVKFEIRNLGGNPTSATVTLEQWNGANYQSYQTLTLDASVSWTKSVTLPEGKYRITASLTNPVTSVQLSLVMVDFNNKSPIIDVLNRTPWIYQIAGIMFIALGLAVQLKK